MAALLLAILAICSTIFTFSSSSGANAAIYSQALSPEDSSLTSGVHSSQQEPLSLNLASDHSPLQALKTEEITVSVTQRIKPSYTLFTVAFLLFGFENESYHTKATYVHAKPLHFTAAIYILFRRIII